MQVAEILKDYKVAPELWDNLDLKVTDAKVAKGDGASLTVSGRFTVSEASGLTVLRCSQRWQALCMLHFRYVPCYVCCLAGMPALLLSSTVAGILIPMNTAHQKL